MTDTYSGSQAADYLARYGVNYGWATNDNDNTSGSNYLLNSGIITAAPWVGVIRVSDMSLYAVDSFWSGNVDLTAVAQELGSD